jgi:hypothetical protein
VFVYNIRDRTADATILEDNFGVVGVDGRPKPVLDVLQSVTRC